MTVDAGAFGEYLCAYRAVAGLSQEELAGRSGLSARAIADMERGRTRWPYPASARRLADALGLAGQVREEFLALARRPVPGLAAPEPVTVPYRGLSAFGEQDAGLFFGREEATARVLELMSSCLDGTGIVIVSGVSGAGKSSLLHAGVLPGLRRDGLAAAPQAKAWPCLAFTPGRNPAAELAVRVAPLAGADAAAVREQLAADPAGFALTARQAALAAGGGQRRVVLVVDQCEQLFTACKSAQERESFVAALHAAATGSSTGQPAALVVLVIRADFEARLADFPQLAAAVQNRYLLTAMTRRQLRLAITQPAAAAGCDVAEDLVQVLLEEAGAGAPRLPGAAGPGALPLLSHALDQAWRARAGQQLTLADYERAGGIDGAVAASAQRAYQALTPAQQHAARQVFTRLTVPGPDGTDTALPAARADLTSGKNAAQAADVEVVLERFAAERLLTLDAGTVAVSHEVLLPAWPLLRDDWLADARADRAVRIGLHATASEWAQHSRDPAYLYRGTRLEAAAATAARITADPRQIPLSQAETGFLAASHRAGQRRVQARRQLTAVLLALLAALATVTLMALHAGQADAAQRDIAVSRLLISQSQALAGTNASVSRLEAIAAWAVNPSPQARDAMLAAAANPKTTTITAGPEAVTKVEFSPDGKTLAASGPSGVRLWNVVTGQQAGKTLDAGDPISAVGFSPDGNTLAASGPSGVRLWNVVTGQQAGKTLDAGDPISAVKFSPDGNTLATASFPGSLQMWDTVTGQPAGHPVMESRDTLINSVTFSPDGKTVTVDGQDAAREDTAQWWNAGSGRQMGKPLAVGPCEPCVEAVSTDGKTIAISNISNSDATSSSGVTLWNTVTSRPAGHLLAGTVGLEVSAMAFSPDGQTLATGGPSGAQLWDVATGQQIGSLTNTANTPFTALAFSPDGDTLAIAGPGGTMLWHAGPFTNVLARICTEAGSSLTPATWAIYVPAGTPYRNPCPPTGTGLSRTQMCGRRSALRAASGRTP